MRSEIVILASFLVLSAMIYFALGAFEASAGQKNMPNSAENSGAAQNQKIQGGQSTAGITNAQAGKTGVQTGAPEDTSANNSTLQAAACEEGTQINCTLENRCAGFQYCQNGILGGCAQKKPVCVLGQKIPCPINSCVFGLSECNSCGQWGECLPPKQS